ncbi:MAG TPA: hypothetical protein VMK42_08910 [Anaeromyxobacteraceae bacterium]|nr:hypothetical protein [Anaeromyxobacteraceae bacterium]
MRRALLLALALAAAACGVKAPPRPPRAEGAGTASDAGPGAPDGGSPCDAARDGGPCDR